MGAFCPIFKNNIQRKCVAFFYCLMCLKYCVETAANEVFALGI